MGMEELTNITKIKVLSSGIPARNKGFIASWETCIDTEENTDYGNQIREEDKEIEKNQEKTKAYKQSGENKSPKKHKENMARRMLSQISEDPRDKKETRKNIGHLLSDNESHSEPMAEPTYQLFNNIDSTYIVQSHQSSGGESRNRFIMNRLRERANVYQLVQEALARVVTGLLLMVSIITVSTAAIYHTWSHSVATDKDSAVAEKYEDRMGNAKSTETVEIMNS